MSVQFTSADRVGGIGGYIGGISTLLGLGNGLWNNNNNCNTGRFVTEDEARMLQCISQKDAEIAHLQADQASEVKMTEVYRQAHNEIVALRDKVDRMKDEQYEINKNQAVWNGATTSAMGCMSSQIAQLYSLTQLKIPNASICPGWDDTSTPTPTTTA